MSVLHCKFELLSLYLRHEEIVMTVI